MSLPKYPGYKDSGVDWLAEIPAHWHLRPLWTLFRRSKRTGHEGEQLLSVYRDFGVVPKAGRDDNNNKPSDDLSTYQLVEQGDLAINKMKAWQGSVAISEHRGIVSPAYFVYEAAHAESSKYLHYLLRSPRYVTGYLSISKGIRVNQWDLEPQYHSRTPVLLPPREEQREIAAFLDRETAKIDALIAEQEELLMLLAEKRQATISHAVTKGLNPDAPMKDSGISWLGQVPEHWSVLTVRRIVTEHRQGYYSESPYVEEGIKLVRITDLGPNATISYGECPSVAMGSDVSPFLVELGDFLFARTGGAGLFGVVDQNVESVAYAAYLIRFRFNEKVDREFMRWYLLSDAAQRAIAQQIHGGVNKNVHAEDIKAVPLVLPPHNEQVDIAEYVRGSTDRWRRLEDEARRAIELMRERRQVLIAAAVTGQIDVRALRSA